MKSLQKILGPVYSFSDDYYITLTEQSLAHSFKNGVIPSFDRKKVKINNLFAFVNLILIQTKSLRSLKSQQWEISFKALCVHWGRIIRISSASFLPFYILEAQTLSMNSSGACWLKVWIPIFMDWFIFVTYILFF